MSVTFSVGTDWDDEARHYNVANASARIILRDMLNVEVEYLCGELDPSEVLQRLATVRPEAHTMQPSDERRDRVVVTAEGVSVTPGVRVIFNGVGADRVGRWVEGMRRLARLAVQDETLISFG